LRISGDAAKTPFLFNGMYGVMTDSNGLYYMRARFYSPEIRRFVNQDILLGKITDGQSLNRYAYVTGNPVSFIDPEGLLAGWIVALGIIDAGFILYETYSFFTEPQEVTVNDVALFAVEVAIETLVLKHFKVPERIAAACGILSRARAPLEHIFEGFNPGQGFSGVIDPDTGRMVMRPSSYDDNIPPGWVPARGGHNQ
jgi:RHS repeat-associated protein